MQKGDKHLMWFKIDGMPRDLVRDFKIVCLSNDTTMKAQISKFMEKAVEKKKLPR